MSLQMLHLINIARDPIRVYGWNYFYAFMRPMSYTCDTPIQFMDENYTFT